MEWQYLQSAGDLNKLNEASFERPVLIYKHSTRCHICTMALARIERGWSAEDSGKLTPFFLDVLKQRDLSNEVERRYRVTHQSPQALVISRGKCVYSESHSSITYHGLIGAAGLSL